MSAEYDQPTGPILSRRRVLALATLGAAWWIAAINEGVKGSQVVSIIEQERINRLLALDIIREFVDVYSNAFVQDLHERISENPDEYIEIVDPLGAPGFYKPNNYSFFIYPEEKNRKGPNDFRDWSILIEVEDSANDALDTIVLIQLNSSGHIYSGPGDIVAPPGVLSLTAKALQADYLFNIPDAMQLTDWVADKDPTSPFLWMRQYPDGNGGVFTQRIGAGNTILLEANFPAQDIPQK